MRVLFFGHLKTVTGVRQIEMDPGAPTLDETAFWGRLCGAFPDLLRFRGSVRLARNGEYAGPGETFLPADEVALIPPVSGG